jgi:hypothetical protein
MSLFRNICLFFQNCYMHQKSLWKLSNPEINSVCNIPQLNAESNKIQESDQAPKKPQLCSVPLLLSICVVTFSPESNTDGGW